MFTPDFWTINRYSKTHPKQPSTKVPGVPTKPLSEIVGNQSNDWWSSHMHSGPWHPASQSLDEVSHRTRRWRCFDPKFGVLKIHFGKLMMIDDGEWFPEVKLILRGIRILPLNKHWTVIVLKLYIYTSHYITIYSYYMWVKSLYCLKVYNQVIVSILSNTVSILSTKKPTSCEFRYKSKCSNPETELQNLLELRIFIKNYSFFKRTWKKNTLYWSLRPLNGTHRF